MESIFCYIPTLLDAVPDDSEAFLKMATLSQAAFFEFLDANAHCGNLKTVRGSLYSTRRDEFTNAIAFHSRRGSSIERDTQDMEHRSHFCSKVVAEFFQHMGWMNADRLPSSVMPSDYATNTTSHRGVLKQDVEADLADGVSLGPLEIIWTPELGAKLPHRPSRKKK